jgi:DNA-binding CsgD family transcriptional regulator
LKTREAGERSRYFHLDAQERRHPALRRGCLYRDVAATHPCFRSLITAESLVPLPAYLTLHDELVRRTLGNDNQSHVELGRESARWALVDGPFKRFLEQRDLTGLVVSFPKLWEMYFTDTTSYSEATLNGDSVEFRAFALPQWHPYFEHFVMGYMAEVLEMFCANPIVATRVRGGAGKQYHYLLHSASARFDAPCDPAPSSKRPTLSETAPDLSDREIEVLLLVAEGKTNDEIGLMLGISGKTAQHHVAKVYRKIAVSNRVGATVWLAERGFIGR